MKVEPINPVNKLNLNLRQNQNGNQFGQQFGHFAFGTFDQNGTQFDSFNWN